MKSDVLPSIRRVVKIVFLILIIVLVLYAYRYNKIYNSIGVSVADSVVIEYGTPNYDINKLVNKVDGKIVSVSNDIETDEIGFQEVVLKVSKGKVTREVPITVEVKDTTGPEIDLGDNITIDQGDSFDYLNNINSILDEVDGDLPYINYSDITDESVGYYSIETDFNNMIPGDYTVKVVAVDKNGNKTEKSYDVVVNARPINDQLINIAYSLIGSPYVSGGNSPSGFDCSGFVQYVYKMVGISISRSSSTQMYDGVAVNYSDIMPGDIINWGHSSGVATHSALYVGNGLMIHATNPSQGVLLSNVAAWERGSADKIIGVRRIK